MQLNLLKSKALVLLILATTAINAQVIHETIPTSGGKASGTNGSATYTVGQIVYKTQTETNGSISEGVQQPFEISEVTGIEADKDLNISCSVFPNPTNDELQLNIKTSSALNFQHLGYQLYDINGKLIENKNISSEKTNIIVKNLLPSTYFIKVTDNEKELKTFKIIKN